MIRIGIICPSEIAQRRFLPSLHKSQVFSFEGIASPDLNDWPEAPHEALNSEKQKAVDVVAKFGGQYFDSYSDIISSDQIDALYIPLPPALHFKYAKMALLAGKHVLVEKPATIDLKQTLELTDLAFTNKLALHENYMFAFHDQLTALDRIVASGEIGEVRLYRISFGFPRRSESDFRYSKVLGGGALLDCGGYTLKYANMLLGNNARLVQARSNYLRDFDVDMFGSAVMCNDDGINAHMSFGMDNQYKCELEVWGSKGILHSGRVLTAPLGFIPECTITKANEMETRQLPEDDAFLKSIEYFGRCIRNDSVRLESYMDIAAQAKLVDEFMKRSN